MKDNLSQLKLSGDAILDVEKEGVDVGVRHVYMYIYVSNSKIVF